MRSAPNKPRNDFIARREHISGSCRENREAREPFFSPSFRHGSADNDSISPELALRRHPIPRDFRAGPVNRGAHVHQVFTSDRSVTFFRPENVSTVQAAGKQCIPPATAAQPGRYSSPGSLCRAACTSPGPGSLLAEQFLPGPAAPHAGRPFRHDVRPGTRGLVANLDQDPAPLAGPGQREAPG